MKALLALIAVGYPAGLVGTIILMMRRDPLSIFNQYYLLATLVLVPAFLLTLVVLIARNEMRPKLIWTAIVGFWVLAVTGAHLWFIGLMAQTV
ncbi:MAG: hypothetical protein LJE62_17025 [Silicimonas sp.]|jgi:hypothetical protein|nr:hypothetical protein [Silicimonas sp.]